MKAFFEEYGFVVVTLVVVFFLIILASWLGNDSDSGVIKNALSSWMSRLTNSVNDFTPNTH